MNNLILIVIVAAVLTLLLRRAFKALPEERWQMLAVIPIQHEPDGAWRGLNLTYYGFFTAMAYTSALIVLLFLLGTINIAVWQAMIVIFAALAVCIPASRLMAGWVEGKKHTFTIGGAAFIGIITLPALVWLAQRYIAPELPPLPTLAAFGIAYCFGEGLGRLACISFGCCHGRPLDQCPDWLRKIFARHAFVFRGATKKIAYQAGQANVPVLPIQAITSVICLLLGLAGMGLFFFAQYKVALILTVAGSQLWRLISEFARADFRGSTSALHLTAYQIMALCGALYALPTVWLLDADLMPIPLLASGWAVLWQPNVILFVQAVWAGMFLYTGCSRVTSSRLNFHVRHEQI